jgi:hypothetical protein
MLILDKSRALDLMVAQSSRVDVPDEFTLAGPPAPSHSGFRVAIYGPLEPAPAHAARPAREGAWQPRWGQRVPLPMAG